MNNADKPINAVLTQSASLQNETSLGLTKREYFAGLALQGLCANYLRDNITGWEIKTYDAEAVELADELLKQLETK